MSDKLDLILEKLEAIESNQNSLKAEIIKRFDELNRLQKENQDERKNRKSF